MQVPINKNWRIATDPQNFTIEKRMIVQSGKTKGDVNWTVMGYYTTLDGAIRGYSRRFMLDGDETTIEGVKSSLANLRREIEALRLGLVN